MQHFLKPTPGATGAGIVSTKLLKKLPATMDNAETALDLSFGWEALAAFAADLVEKSYCSLQSLLPDGFARRITESELLLIYSNRFLKFELRNRRASGGEPIKTAN
jgi:hypothetical protein